MYDLQQTQIGQIQKKSLKKLSQIQKQGKKNYVKWNKDDSRILPIYDLNQM